MIHGGATERFVSETSRLARPDPDRAVACSSGADNAPKGIDVLVQGLPDGIGLDIVGHVYDEEYLAFCIDWPRAVT